MKRVFDNVDAKCLSKEAIKKRTFPLEDYVDVADIFQFIDWTKEDSNQTIQYSFAETKLGRLLIASTTKGICFLGFVCGDDSAIKTDFQKRFSKQQVEEQLSHFQQLAIDYCNGNRLQIVPLHIKGTNFQVDIWKKLVRIPEGQLSTYGFLLDGSKAYQAVGSAVGANPVSYIIPCHRIVKGNGDYQGYHWGSELKKQLLAYELQL